MHRVTQEETRLGEHRLAENDRALGDPIQISESLGVQPVARITERDERRRVDQNHRRRATLAPGRGARSKVLGADGFAHDVGNLDPCCAQLGGATWGGGRREHPRECGRADGDGRSSAREMRFAARSS